jgi:hypothetical protein
VGVDGHDQRVITPRTLATSITVASDEPRRPVLEWKLEMPRQPMPSAGGVHDIRREEGA